MDSNSQAALIGAIVGVVLSTIVQLFGYVIKSHQDRRLIIDAIIQDLDFLKSSLQGLYADASDGWGESQRKIVAKFKIIDPINLSNLYRLNGKLDDSDTNNLNEVRLSLADCESARLDLIDGLATDQEVADYWIAVQGLIVTIDKSITPLRNLR